MIPGSNQFAVYKKKWREIFCAKQILVRQTLQIANWATVWDCSAIYHSTCSIFFFVVYFLWTCLHWNLTRFYVTNGRKTVLNFWAPLWNHSFQNLSSFFHEVVPILGSCRNDFKKFSQNDFDTRHFGSSYSFWNSLTLIPFFDLLSKKMRAILTFISFFKSGKNLFFSQSH